MLDVAKMLGRSCTKKKEKSLAPEIEAQAHDKNHFQPKDPRS